MCNFLALGWVWIERWEENVGRENGGHTHVPSYAVVHEAYGPQLLNQHREILWALLMLLWLYQCFFFYYFFKNFLVVCLITGLILSFREYLLRWDTLFLSALHQVSWGPLTEVGLS